MSGRVVDFSRSAHRHVQELLPWYLTGKLDEGERVAVEAHLRSCALCQHDLQVERVLQQACAGAITSWDADVGLAQLQQRLDKPARWWVPHALRWVRMRASPLWGISPRWVGYAAVAQLLLIAVLGWALFERDASAPYRTLGAGRPALTDPGAILVVFDPNLREGELEALLRGVGGHITSGPNEAGGYVLVIDPKFRASALQKLRADRHVRLAEALQPSMPP